MSFQLNCIADLFVKEFLAFWLQMQKSAQTVTDPKTNKHKFRIQIKFHGIVADYFQGSHFGYILMQTMNEHL